MTAPPIEAADIRTAASPVRWIIWLCLVGLGASTHAGTLTIESRIVDETDRAARNAARPAPIS